MRGILYGVGVGPGDPELMTVKALRVIKFCDVAAYPKGGQEKSVALEIAQKACPELEKKEQLCLEFPMTREKEKLELARTSAAEKIAVLLEQGKNVAFLTLGDPSVYSTYAYLHRLIRKMGYEAQMIPGVPSFCAAAALLGDSLTDAGQPLRIIPASYECAEQELRGNGTKVLMKSGRSIQRVKELLQNLGLSRSTKAVINCGMEGERVCSLEELREKESYFSLLIVKEAEK